MNTSSKLARIVLVSPWFLLLFLVVPVWIVLSLTLHVANPVADAPLILFINNCLLACVVACRLLRYCIGIPRATRYGAGHGRPQKGTISSQSLNDTRTALQRGGYTFVSDGGYGERRDVGYFGTILFYGGLLLILSVGIWSNLCQFSGTILDGMGPGTDLGKKTSYRFLKMGPMAPELRGLPFMHIDDQILPNDTYPKGATVVELQSDDGTVRTETLKPVEPIHYGPYDIYMTKLVFEPQLVIKDRNGNVLFDSLIMLDPLVKKRGDYGFYGIFIGPNVHGGVYYQPEKSRMKVVITRDDKKVVAGMVFQVDQKVVQGDYVLSCAKMGQWSELHVVRHRNMSDMIIGAIIALIGLIMRAGFPARRVWLVETSAGCTVYATDGEEVKKLLRVES